MSVGTHYEEICPKIESPHFESLAGSQARRWKAFRSRRDIMAGQGRRQSAHGTVRGASSVF